MNIRKVNDAAVWLYGSYARGCEDQYSDFDILVVSDHSILLKSCDLPIPIESEKLSISTYSWAEFRAMASYGSVFLHHLRKEARLIYESKEVEGRLFNILKTLCPYKRVQNDIESFFQVISDVEESINNDCSYEYELSVLGTLLRHSCILGCYMDGFQAFGRSEPVKAIVNRWGLDQAISSEFEDLYSFRLFSYRGTYTPSRVGLEYLVLWCSRIKLILKIIQERANVYERKLLATD